MRSRAENSAAAAVENTRVDMSATANVACDMFSSVVPRLTVSSSKGCGEPPGFCTGRLM